MIWLIVFSLISLFSLLSLYSRFIILSLFSIFSLFSLFSKCCLLIVISLFSLLGLISLFSLFIPFILFSLFYLISLFSIFSLFIIFSIFSIFSPFSIFSLSSLLSLFSVFRLLSLFFLFRLFSLFSLFILFSLFSLFILFSLSVEEDKKIELGRMEWMRLSVSESVTIIRPGDASACENVKYLYKFQITACRLDPAKLGPSVWVCIFYFLLAQFRVKYHQSFLRVFIENIPQNIGFQFHCFLGKITRSWVSWVEIGKQENEHFIQGFSSIWKQCFLFFSVWGLINYDK